MARFPTTDWIDAGWAYPVRNRDQLLRTIGRISTLHAGRVYAWRGQRAAWGLSSSLHRELADSGPVDESRMRLAETHILKRAREYGLGRELGPSNTDANLLATLQHHGVPTRLFDVTSNPMTALWFACQQPEAGKRRTSGVLFAIDVTNTRWMASAEFGHPTWGVARDPLGAAYEAALDVSRDDQRPFRLYPALPDERMKAQEGYFLVSAVPSQPAIPHVPDLALSSSSPPGSVALRQLVESPERGPGRPPNLPFVALVIPPDVKDALRGPLKGTYNRRRRVLFPDVDGFRSAFDHGEETLEDDPALSAVDPQGGGDRE